MTRSRSLLLTALLASACAHEKWIRTELYFGSARTEGRSAVSAGEWERFAREEIASRFPEGFTIVPARGHWLGDAGPQDEESHLVVLVHQRDDETSSRKLDELREVYKKRFSQDAVLRIDQPASAGF